MENQASLVMNWEQFQLRLARRLKLPTQIRCRAEAHLEATTRSQPMTDEEFEVRLKEYQQQQKEKMWELLSTKKYEDAALLGAGLLQDNFAFDAIHICGLALTALDKFEEGIDWTTASLALSRASVDWYNNAAVAMMEKKQYVHSMLYAENGVKEYPEDVRLHYMRGLCMCFTQSWDNALPYLNHTIKLDPKFHHAYMSKGFVLHMLGRYDAAIACYESCYSFCPEPEREQMVNNHVCVLMELCKYQEAIDLLDREYPNSARPGTIYNRSFLYLGYGKWPEGWDMYRQRLAVQVNGDQGVPEVEQPIAQTLDEIKNKHLFLFHEQGLGDSLHFLRYAKLLRPHLSELTIGVPKPLARLALYLNMDESFNIVCDAERDRPIFTECDVALPLLDAPALLEQRLDNIPVQIPYFILPDEITEMHPLPETGKKRIGLAWAGASRQDNIRAHSIDKRRSVPIHLMEPILAFHDEFQFVSLQMSDNHIEDKRLLQPIEDSFDVLDTMSIVKQLDLVITVDSSVAHMAGSIGKPVWLLSRYDGCWRWFWNDHAAGTENWSSSPWYPSMKIFRQPGHGKWSRVVEQVVEELETMVTQRVSCAAD